MKKIGLLVAPLIAVSFLASCGSKKTFAVTIGEVDHLSFTTMDGKSIDTIRATEGEDFKFKMKSFNDTSNYDYIVPTMIDIVIDSMKPLLDGYHIENVTDTEANVIIDANKVIGDIVISGEAGVKNGYRYEMPYHYGLEEVPSGVIDKSQILTISFTPTSKDSNENYQMPNAENIYILFDNCPGTQPMLWVSPDESGVEEYCKYNQNTGELTIYSNHIKSNIVIVARANDYPLLDKLSWEDINEISFSGAAEYIFYLGEEKWVEVNDLNHRVRIIGFDHDDLVNSSAKAGITFEFVNLITKSDYSVDATTWNNKNGSNSDNYNFCESTLNDFLNNNRDCIFNKLPDKLQTVIKNVNKKVGLGKSYSTTTPYQTKLFPLAHDEITTHKSGVPTGEGTIYQYYENELVGHAKTIVGGILSQYWIRSPLAAGGIHDMHYAWHVDINGNIVYDRILVYNVPCGVAPAFCV